MFDFRIKVSDLLKKIGGRDLLQIQEVSLSLDGFVKNSLNCEVELQSLNKNTIFVSIKNLNCDIEDVCDFGSEKYIRHVSVSEYSSRFVFSGVDENIDDIFFIDPKTETINIEDIITQSIVLQEPFSKLCEEHIRFVSEMDDNEEGYQ